MPAMNDKRHHGTAPHTPAPVARHAKRDRFRTQALGGLGGTWAAGGPGRRSEAEEWRGDRNARRQLCPEPEQTYARNGDRRQHGDNGAEYGSPFASPA